MAGEPQNMVLTLLREIRAELDHAKASDAAVKADIADLRREMVKRFSSLQQAMTGESVLGRYAVAEVEGRLDAMEKRLAALEGKTPKSTPPKSTPRKPQS